MKKEYTERHCIVCGAGFVPENPRVHTCREHRGISTARFKTRFCCKCGGSFELGSGFDWYFCSSVCKIKEDEQNSRSKNKKAKTGLDLMRERAKIARDGQKEHLTYGQMVAKYNL